MKETIASIKGVMESVSQRVWGEMGLGVGGDTCQIMEFDSTNETIDQSSGGSQLKRVLGGSTQEVLM